MKFKNNLRALRKANNLTQDDLAHKLGYKSFTTVQKWEDGTAYPKMENLMLMADMFGISIDRLLDGDLSKEVTKMVPIPIIGIVRTGPGIYAEQDFFGYEYCVDKDSKGAEYFYLKITGDSMINARILDGDIVYVRRQSNVENNDLAIVLLENNEVTLKRIVFENDGMTLKPANDTYKSMHFSYQEMQEKGIQIIGKVIHNKILF